MLLTLECLWRRYCFYVHAVVALNVVERKKRKPSAQKGRLSLIYILQRACSADKL